MTLMMLEYQAYHRLPGIGNTFIIIYITTRRAVTALAYDGKRSALYSAGRDCGIHEWSVGNPVRMIVVHCIVTLGYSLIYQTVQGTYALGNRCEVYWV